jgi:hypothetical protein
MANAKKLAMVVSGCATATVVALATASMEPARAAASKGSTLQVQSINLSQSSGVPANSVIELTMSQAIKSSSVTPATLQVRGLNATGTQYAKQVFGSIQVVGNLIRFYPRLPTHLRDSSGNFYPAGTAQDDAAANAGFKPSTGYEVRLIGRPAITTIQSTTNRPLKITTYARFSTAAASPPEKLWTTKSYSDSPPPQFSFSNPPDTVPSAATQYATHGGTQDVPNSILVSLFCTRVPLAPGTARIQGNVEMTMLARKDDYTLRRPVAGSVFIEQNFDTTLMAFRPRVSLADLGTYSLRVGKGVKDLTEQNDFAVNRQRETLREIYDFLAAARALSPGVPVSSLPDPPAELITDWPPLVDDDGNPIPGAEAERGVLKVNVLALGDKYPDEIDPRTMLIFTTRDEPVTSDSVSVEFTKAENLYDAQLSTGEVDTSVPSAAAATFTVAGGSGALGDLLPTSNQTISADSVPNSELNYRYINIPNNVIITFTGVKPPTIKSLSIIVNGELRANGNTGGDSLQQSSSTYSTIFNSSNSAQGGTGGPGGGKGGAGATTFSPTSLGGTPAVGGTGLAGNDVNVVTAVAQDGGRGGLGGSQASGTGAYSEGGGGGGGGGTRTAGTAGANGAGAYPSWSGSGGQGGSAAIGNDDLSPLVGGAGGGAGGNGGYVYYTWGSSGGGGGGGGGAMLIQTAGTLTVGPNGAIRCRGGAGGRGSGYYTGYVTGPGGAGGGGSLLLRSTKGYSIANPTVSLDVTGGTGGVQNGSTTYAAPYGGNGGAGLIRTEDPNGGISIPGATQGLFQPIGAGVPSFIYTKWIDLGVQDPRIVAWKLDDVVNTTVNDAIYIQTQMTKEHPTLFGTPNTTAINSSTQNSNNLSIMSNFIPIFLHDETGVAGGAFTPTLGPIPGLPANNPKEYASFDIAALNGKGYRFIRFRIYFQLDSTHTAASPLPFVDRLTTNFQFNF